MGGVGEVEDAYEHAYSSSSPQRIETRRPDEIVTSELLSILMFGSGDCLKREMGVRGDLYMFGKWHWWEDKDDARASLIQTELKTDNDTTTKAVRRRGGGDDDIERGSSNRYKGKDRGMLIFL